MAMCVRIIQGRVRPGEWERYETAFREVLCAEVVPGLKARWLMRDAVDPDAGVSLSLWESEAAMRAYEADTPRRERLFKAMEPCFTGEFHEQRCELRVVRDFAG